MSLGLSPIGNDAPFVDANGDPLSGGKLYVYLAGSATPATTYQDADGTTPNSNPIVLNSNGYPASGGSVVEIWLTESASYLFELKTSADVLVWSRDDIEVINDVSVAQDQWVTGPTPTYISAVSFSLVGDQTSTFHIGRRLKSSNTGGTVYSTIVNSAFSVVTTVTVVNDAGASLDSGMSSVSYGLLSAANPSEPAIGAEYICQGRLTLTSGTPVTTADVTAAETVYFAPFRGNKVDIYDATAARWVRYAFSELSVDVPDATQMSDVFIYNNAGTLTLDVTAWTNDTTRATDLTTQDGVLVKTGATGRRYLGSFYCTTAGNGQTEDSLANRYLWNYYNRVARPMRVLEATNTWTYTTATIRQANGAAGNQLNFCIGVSEDKVTADVYVTSSNTNASVNTGVYVGLDATNAMASGGRGALFGNVGTDERAQQSATWTGFPGVGKHFLAWLEYSEATGTTTWYGDDNAPTLEQSGIYGELLG